MLPVCSGKGQTKIMLTGVQAVFQSLCYPPQMNESTGTCTVTFSGSNFSHVHAMLLGCCADSVLSVEKLSKAVPFLRCPRDDWTDDYGADSLTTEVSQLNCSDNAQGSHVHMLVCASVFQFGMRMYVNSCNDDSCHSIM